MVFLYIFGKKLFNIFVPMSLFFFTGTIMIGCSLVSGVVCSVIAIIGFCIMQSAEEATEAMNEAMKIVMKEKKGEKAK